MARKRIGFRNRYVSFLRHNGNVDASGNPTYSTPDDWYLVARGWPAEVLNTSGGEVIRGRQVTAETTHVLYGEWSYVQEISPRDRITFNGVTLEIVSVTDPEGLRYEMRIEAKREAT